MAQKDLFSDHSKIYATFRPTYPEDLYAFILSHVKQRDTAWDCGTGNGQVAYALSKYFRHVYATDLSKQQIEHGILAPNITYSVAPAERTSFPEKYFDLITVGQALHWFDIPKFYDEVRRTGRPGGYVGLWGYALCVISKEIDPLFLHFYNHVVGPYWDSARRLVEQEYATVDFPFEQIPAPPFVIKVNWDLDQFAGYVTSWSATQKYMRAQGQNPVPSFVEQLKQFWKPEDKKEVSFPVFLKLGRIS